MSERTPIDITAVRAWEREQVYPMVYGADGHLGVQFLVRQADHSRTVYREADFADYSLYLVAKRVFFMGREWEDIPLDAPETIVDEIEQLGRTDPVVMLPGVRYDVPEPHAVAV